MTEDALREGDRVRHQKDGRLGKVAEVFVPSQDAYYFVKWDAEELEDDVLYWREELLAIREARS